MLLAYYIAAINIEATYHSLIGGDYQPFEGICLTDTFQMYEKDDLVDELLVHNSERRKRQKALDIRVIVGNPPYSSGQDSANDNAANVSYPHLNDRIRDTYATRGTATNKNGLYDSYIRAIRWACDRIGESGVIGFVTNAGWLDSRVTDGMRQCLVEEFASLYVFHLRGLRGQKTSGEQAKKEGGQIFGMGSAAAIAISVLVKNPAAKEQGQIYFRDIGDYLSRDDKLDNIGVLASVGGITKVDGWQNITPDSHGDWLNQRDGRFDQYIAIGDKKNGKTALFENYSNGVKTQRDAWCFNPSKAAVVGNINRTISFYNSEVERFQSAHTGLDAQARKAEAGDFINYDPTKISWTHALKQELAKGRILQYDANCLVASIYRPFDKQWLYFNRELNERVYQTPYLFPDTSEQNIVIGCSAPSQRSNFSVSIGHDVPSLHAVDMVGSQCFPLYVYDKPAKQEDGAQQDIFDAGPSSSGRREAITDEGLVHFQEAYPNETITKEAIFYYVYGLLHSPDYRERYKNNLAKELPRIPRVKTAADFWAFSQAGRDLADLHLNYETVAMYAGATIEHGDTPLTDDDYYVTKMKHPKVKDPDTGKGVNDLTRVVYNNRITVTDIPEEAYGYVVNGKPAIEWVIERQRVKTDKASGIVSDANDWAIETVGNPKYPLELLLRIITVSQETMEIVHSLPVLDIEK